MPDKAARSRPSAETKAQQGAKSPAVVEDLLGRDRIRHNSKSPIVAYSRGLRPRSRPEYASRSPTTPMVTSTTTTTAESQLPRDQKAFGRYKTPGPPPPHQCQPPHDSKSSAEINKPLALPQHQHQPPRDMKFYGRCQSPIPRINARYLVIRRPSAGNNHSTGSTPAKSRPGGLRSMSKTTTSSMPATS